MEAAPLASDRSPWRDRGADYHHRCHQILGRRAAMGLVQNLEHLACRRLRWIFLVPGALAPAQFQPQLLKQPRLHVSRCGRSAGVSRLSVYFFDEVGIEEGRGVWRCPRLAASRASSGGKQAAGATAVVLVIEAEIE